MPKKLIFQETISLALTTEMKNELTEFYSDGKVWYSTPVSLRTDKLDIVGETLQDFIRYCLYRKINLLNLLLERRG